MNSVKSSDFMSPRGALAMLCHAPRARILCQKHYAGDMRARRRERMSKSFQSRRHHRHRRWPCRRRRRHRRRHRLPHHVATVVDVIMPSRPRESPTCNDVPARQRGL